MGIRVAVLDDSVNVSQRVADWHACRETILGAASLLNAVQAFLINCIVKADTGTFNRIS